MKQASMVSFYGEKNLVLTDLIKACRAVAGRILKSAFTEPYPLDQVHATLVGLERKEDTFDTNAAFWNYRGREVVMDLEGFAAFVRSFADFPISLQIGGFQNRTYPFHSDPFETGMKHRPYDRTFTVQGNKLVVMGWPVVGEPSACVDEAQTKRETELYPRSLHQLRLAAQSFGILHKYHRTPTAIDNDFYFRIGSLDPSTVSRTQLDNLRKAMHTEIFDEMPRIVTLTERDVSIAVYEDERLPRDATMVWPISDLHNQEAFFARLKKVFA